MNRIMIYSSGIRRPCGFRTVIENLFLPGYGEYEYAIVFEESESYLSTKQRILRLAFSSIDVLKDFIDWWKPSAVMILGCHAQLYYWFKYNIPLPTIALFHIERLKLSKWIYSFFKHVWFTIVPSRFTKNVLGLPCEIITWGVDHDIFYPSEPIRERDIFIYGSVTAPIFRKLNDRTIRAYALLKSQHSFESRLFLHCCPIAIERSPDLLSLREEYGLANELVFPPKQVGRFGVASISMGNVYRSFDVHVLASCETFGLPYLEAMACGIPNIAIEAGNAVDLLKDCGLLVPYSDTIEDRAGLMPLIDIEKYADAMWALYSDEDLYHKYRERGIEKAKQYTWEKSRRRLIEILNKYFC